MYDKPQPSSTTSIVQDYLGIPNGLKVRSASYSISIPAQKQCSYFELSYGVTLDDDSELPSFMSFDEITLTLNVNPTTNDYVG